jgi:hypothetical protein
VSRSGRPWRESKVVEKKLNPMLRKLGITPKGLNGFRHFNATEMDSRNVPIKTRQSRLGHDDPRVTLGMKNKNGYTHMVGEDDPEQQPFLAICSRRFCVQMCPSATRLRCKTLKEPFEVRDLQGFRENPQLMG